MVENGQDVDQAVRHYATNLAKAFSGVGLLSYPDPMPRSTYIDARLRPIQATRAEWPRRDISETLDEDAFLQKWISQPIPTLVIGAVGSGKSCLIESLALKFAAILDEDGSSERSPVPLIVSLAEAAASDTPIHEYLEEAEQRLYRRLKIKLLPALSQDVLSHLRTTGRLVYLLDGWDEVPLRQELMAHHVRELGSFLMTSRPGYNAQAVLPADGQQLELVEWGVEEQENYVNRYFAERHASFGHHAASELLAVSQSIPGLTSRPLHLKAYCDHWAFDPSTATPLTSTDLMQQQLRRYLIRRGAQQTSNDPDGENIERLTRWIGAIGIAFANDDFRDMDLGDAERKRFTPQFDLAQFKQLREWAVQSGLIVRPTSRHRFMLNKVPLVEVAIGRELADDARNNPTCPCLLVDTFRRWIWRPHLHDCLDHAFTFLWTGSTRQRQWARELLTWSSDTALRDPTRGAGPSNARDDLPLTLAFQCLRWWSSAPRTDFTEDIRRAIGRAILHLSTEWPRPFGRVPLPRNLSFPSELAEWCFEAITNHWHSEPADEMSDWEYLWEAASKELSADAAIRLWRGMLRQLVQFPYVDVDRWERPFRHLIEQIPEDQAALLVDELWRQAFMGEAVDPRAYEPAAMIAIGLHTADKDLFIHRYFDCSKTAAVPPSIVGICSYIADGASPEVLLQLRELAFAKLESETDFKERRAWWWILFNSLTFRPAAQLWEGFTQLLSLQDTTVDDRMMCSVITRIIDIAPEDDFARMLELLLTVHEGKPPELRHTWDELLVRVAKRWYPEKNVRRELYERFPKGAPSLKREWIEAPNSAATVLSFVETLELNKTSGESRRALNAMVCQFDFSTSLARALELYGEYLVESEHIPCPNASTAIYLAVQYIPDRDALAFVKQAIERTPQSRMGSIHTLCKAVKESVKAVPAEQIVYTVDWLCEQVALSSDDERSYWEFVIRDYVRECPANAIDLVLPDLVEQRLFLAASELLDVAPHLAIVRRPADAVLDALSLYFPEPCPYEVMPRTSLRLDPGQECASIAIQSVLLASFERRFMEWSQMPEGIEKEDLQKTLLQEIRSWRKHQEIKGKVSEWDRSLKNGPENASPFYPAERPFFLEPPPSSSPVEQSARRKELAKVFAEFQRLAEKPEDMLEWRSRLEGFVEVWALMAQAFSDRATGVADAACACLMQYLMLRGKRDQSRTLFQSVKLALAHARRCQADIEDINDPNSEALLNEWNAGIESLSRFAPKPSKTFDTRRRDARQALISHFGDDVRKVLEPIRIFEGERPKRRR